MHSTRKDTVKNKTNFFVILVYENTGIYSANTKPVGYGPMWNDRSFHKEWLLIKGLVQLCASCSVRFVTISKVPVFSFFFTETSSYFLTVTSTDQKKKHNPGRLWTYLTSSTTRPMLSTWDLWLLTPASRQSGSPSPSCPLPSLPPSSVAPPADSALARPRSSLPLMSWNLLRRWASLELAQGLSGFLRMLILCSAKRDSFFILLFF